MHQNDNDPLSTTTIKNSSFIGNKNQHKGTSSQVADGLGGAVYGEHVNLVVEGENPGSSVFSDNHAEYRGGAIGLWTNTTLNVSNTTFESNSANDRGGAIYVEAIGVAGSTNNIVEIGNQTKFVSNSSEKAGGAIALSDFKSNNAIAVSISDTTFDGNHATTKGGAVVIYDMEGHQFIDTTMANVTFTNNFTTSTNAGESTGGAIHTESDLTITGNSVFENNSASGNGGAIYVGQTAAASAQHNTATLTLDTDESYVIKFANNKVGDTANDIYLAKDSAATFTGNGSIELLSGLAGAGDVTSNAANVYVADVTGYTGKLTITGGVFAVEAGSFLNTDEYIFGDNANVTIEQGGELKLAGVTKAGAINITTGTIIGSNNITFEDAFLTGTLGDNGQLTISTNDTFIKGSDFGDDTDKVQANLASLFARGATARESDILEQISEKFVAEGDQALSTEGVEAFRQATGGSATAGAFNVAYDAQTQFTDSIIRHQLGEHNGYGVWADVYYTFNEAKTLYGNSGYKTDIYGGVVGFDATFSCGATAGIAVTVGTGDTDTVGALKSSLDTDFYGVSLYTSKDFSGFDAKLDVGYMSFDNDFAGLGDAADVDAWTAGLRGDFKAYEGSVMSITPHVGLRYTHFKSDAVAFNGETSLDVFEAPIGVAFNGNFETNGWKIVPALDFSIVPQLGDTDVDTFAGTVDVIDNLYNTTLGVAATYQNLTFGLDYRYGFGNEDRSNNSVNLKVRYRF